MARENARENNHISGKNKRKLLLMILSVILMIFCVIQVYYLARYTFGKSVSEKDMRVYKWVRQLVSENETESANDTEKE